VPEAVMSVGKSAINMIYTPKSSNGNYHRDIISSSQYLRNVMILHQIDIDMI